MSRCTSVILFTPRLRRHALLRMLALALVVGGLVAYRWDVNLLGQLVVPTMKVLETAPLYTNYTPSLIEYITGAGVVAYGLLAFTLGVRYLGVIDHSRRETELAPHAELRPVFAGD